MATTTYTRPTVKTGPDAGRPAFMGMDGEDRCLTCDCRYCSDHCHAYTDRVYVVGRGYLPVEVAQTLVSTHEVRFDAKGFLPITQEAAR